MYQTGQGLLVTYGVWIAEFLGVTSGSAGVTITKFLSAIPLDYETRIALSLEQFGDLSGVVSEHIVTYIRAWSVTPTFSLYPISR